MAEEQDLITAQVGIFSGRENPVITLSGNTQTRFAELVRSIIGRQSTHPPGPPKLGEFFGFAVSIPRKISEENDLPKYVEVRGGVVSQISAGEAEYWLDVAGLEDFLINMAFELGYGELLGHLGIKRGHTD